MVSASPVEVFLQPGQYFVGDERHRVQTILGSCVSFTLWHPQKKIGAMSHCVLPSRRNRKQAKLDAYYIDEAIQLLIHELRLRGVEPSECEVKIFGGGDMFPEQVSTRTLPAVGRQNGEAARRLLRECGFKVTSGNLFGVGCRKIAFNVESGEVSLKLLGPLAQL